VLDYAPHHKDLLGKEVKLCVFLTSAPYRCQGST